MYENLLVDTYNQIKSKFTFPLEEFEVVKLVHDYRMYWKPSKVKVLLLAESHVFTDKSLTNLKFDLNKVDIQNLPLFSNLSCPSEHVNFVYCLSYGASCILEEAKKDYGTQLRKNTGTPQFWKLFNETVFSKYHIVNNYNQKNKLEEKINLLNEMRESGIWLLDTSIVGIYQEGIKPSSEEYELILQSSFKGYCLPIIKDLMPDSIIVIGKSVYDILSRELNSLEIKVDWIHQPNARVRQEQRRTYKNTILKNTTDY